MKVIGLVINFDGKKTKCSLCNRSHGRSFVCEDASGQRFHYGSGCVQKVGIDKRHLASILSKVTVQSARLSYELIKNSE